MRHGILLVAHCLLNPLAKVRGLATTSGPLPLIKELVEAGIPVLQLPCPEHSLLGGLRWGMTREQYDTPMYRAHCARLLAPLLEELEDYTACGLPVLGVLGIDGSPSCGVRRSCSGYSGGELSLLDRLPAQREAPGSGVFLRTLRDSLAAHKLHPPFAGIDEASPHTASWPALAALLDL